MKIKIRIIDGHKEKNSNTVYKTEVDAKNYKELSKLLIDLRNLGLPISKSIKQFNLIKSDWNAALGF